MVTLPVSQSTLPTILLKELESLHNSSVPRRLQKHHVLSLADRHVKYEDDDDGGGRDPPHVYLGGQDHPVSPFQFSRNARSPARSVRQTGNAMPKWI